MPALAPKSQGRVDALTGEDALSIGGALSVSEEPSRYSLSLFGEVAPVGSHCLPHPTGELGHVRSRGPIGSLGLYIGCAIPGTGAVPTST